MNIFMEKYPKGITIKSKDCLSPISIIGSQDIGADDMREECTSLIARPIFNLFFQPNKKIIVRKMHECAG